MALAAGTSLGPYRIVAPLGVGGMGEVYRAHDDRLDRQVAIKILPESVGADAERLERFEREARAAAALNHPGIVSVFDIGRASTPPVGAASTVAYVVMELLEGATLRDELSARPPTSRKAIAWGVDVAQGLAAAHARGIVHRDVKPENLFVTNDGRIKILDFGIARVSAGTGGGDAAPPMDAPTVAAGTEPGKVLGTAGYMSPEQVRGEAVDARSDIFALGAVLYEMLAGRRAFAGDTAVETMHAVLRSDPPDIEGEGGRSVPPALDRIVRRCLEKRPEDRFHSAHDLSLALEAVSGSHTGAAAVAEVGPVRSRRAGVAAVGALALVAVLGAAGSGWWLGRDTAGAGPPGVEVRQITARRGTIDAARFTSGGDAVVYSARFAGAPPAPFRTHLNSPEAQQIGPDNAILFSTSEGALALGLAPQLSTGQYVGTLATLPPGAGAAREIAPRMLDAAFVQRGLAAIEATGVEFRLHVPVGTVVEEGRGLALLRARPDGRALAYLAIDGLIVRADDGTRTVIADVGATGLAWSPEGDRLWFSRGSGSGMASIWSVAEGEAPREEWRSLGPLVLEDIAADGRLLVRRDERHGGTIVVTPDAPEPVDLSWLDRAQAVGLSTPARTVLLNDAAGMYVRSLGGSPAVRLGGGGANAFSPDGGYAISGGGERFTIVPVGAGTSRTLAHPGVESHYAWFHPDGKTLLFNGREPGGTWRFFAMNLDGSGEVRKVGPDNVEHYIGQEPLSSDGRLLAGFPLPERVRTVYPLEGGEPIPIAGIEENEIISRFAEGDRELFVYNRAGLPMRIYRLNFRTGERTLWREFMPGDPAGIDGIRTIVMSADGRTIAFNYIRVLSTLYEVSGLR